MIYLVEGYGPFSKVSKTETDYEKASKLLDEYNNMGYISSITPLDLTREKFGMALEVAVKEYFEETDVEKN